MENKKNKEKTLGIIALVIAVLGTGVAFAALSTTLNITGTAEVTPEQWKINYKNLSEPIINGQSKVINAPTLSNTSIEDFDIQLTKPGDSIKYTFDIVNNGTLNAKIGSYTAPNPICSGTGGAALADSNLVCSNLTYTIKYVSNGEAIKENDSLNSSQTRKVELTISYSGSTLPSNEVEITGLGLSMVYVEM